MSARKRIRQGVVPGVFAAVQLVRMALVLRLPEARLAGTQPDDAFYYLQTARTFAATGHWSFDGVEPASGFHLLWGYLLAAMYWLCPDIGLHAVVAVGWLVAIACMTAATWLCVDAATRLLGDGASVGVGVIFLSTASLECGGWLMEAPLLMLDSAAVVWLLSREQERRADLLLAGVLGWLGVLARSDFGLLPLALLLVAVAMRKRCRLPGFALTGAALGQLTLALHTHWISGQWVQASARQKLFWSALQGFSMRPVTTLLLEYFDGNAVANGFRPWGLWVARLIVVALLVGVAFAMRRRGAWVLVAMLAVVGGYVLLYRFNSADLQLWYIAEFQIPLSLLAAGAFAALPQRKMLCLGVALCCWGIVASMPWQPVTASPFYNAGLYLREHPELRPAGAWNAGMIGYISGGGVTNLDGLVNDRIHAYAVSDTALDYVQQRGLKTILDFPTMVDPAAMQRDGPPNLARRNGYSDGRLQRCLHLETMVGSIGVYRINCGR